jgi:mannitol-1-/sugar-/sorbitol-6-phosphatase
MSVDLTDVDAVLFDMDGTLVDSDAAVERAWVSWCAEYGVDPAAALAVAHGRPAAGTVRELRPDLSADEVVLAAARQLELQYDDLSDVVATPGMRQAIAELDRLGVPWAVVTSADRRLAAARLTAAGLAVVPLLVTAEDVTAGKPDPEGYLRAAELLGVDPARTLVVEDAEAGIAAGRAAGARVAALKGLDADLRLTDLGQLADLLRSRG